MVTAQVDGVLPKDSPLVGFLRHSPPSPLASEEQSRRRPSSSLQALHSNFDQLLLRRSRVVPGASSDNVSQLPKGSPYVGSQRHSPLSPLAVTRLSPLLGFGCSVTSGADVPELEDFKLDDRCEGDADEENSSGLFGQLPEETWHLILSMSVEVHRISSFATMSRFVAASLKSDAVWAGRSMRLPFAGITRLAPVLHQWLPAWGNVKKLVIPRSKQLIAELSKEAPHIPVEVAWRFDPAMKGAGVMVINYGMSVRRLPDSDEELVVLGDAPVPLHGDVHHFEIRLDELAKENDHDEDNLNDFGIGFTARPPTKCEDLGAVAGEVPMSWVIDFTKNSVVLSVNNREASRGRRLTAAALKQGDRVGLGLNSAGRFEIFINGELRESLNVPPSDGVPQGADLFPVLDLYGCPVQLSRTDH